jgi:methyl-accepting chemotaxis protein
VIAMMAAIIAVAWLRLDGISRAADTIASKDAAKLAVAADLVALTRGSGQRALEAVFTNDAAQRTDALEAVARQRKEVDAALQTLDRLVYTAEGKAMLAQFRAEYGRYDDALGQGIELLKAGKRDDAGRKLLGDALPTLEPLCATGKRLVEWQERLIANATSAIESSYATARARMLAIGAGAIALAAALGWLLKRSIVQPMREAIVAATRIRDGDLTQEIEARTADETGELLAALRDMQASLRNIVGRVRSGVDSVGTASAQIAAGNQDLSARTEEQASSLQQTAASMEQLTCTVRQSADNARQANQLAAAASEAAGKGGAVVGQVVATMEEISAASRKIAEIINVIDGIAFQTNILALNAAVEAARAGEQGRGFAVVAGEVRNLAQRCAQAAREIKHMIGDSVQKVDSGSRLVNEAGVSMNEIVAQVKRVTDLIGEISSASVEQSTGLGQINGAVTQIDQVTQQNAALVEHSAAAAQSLKEQAARLAEAVGVFRLAQGEMRQVIAQAQATSKAVDAPRAAAPRSAAARPIVRPVKPDGDNGDWQEF